MLTAVSSSSPIDMSSSKIEPEKPELLPPLLAPPLEAKLANLNQKLRETKKAVSEIQIDQMEFAQQALANANQQRLEELRRSADDYASSTFWSFLSNLASFFTAFFSLVAGIGQANPLLIGAGLLSMANVLLNDTGGWDWIGQKLSGGDEEMNVFLRNILPMVVSLLLFGLTFSSNAYGWFLEEKKDQTATLLATLGSLFSGISSIGASHAKSKVIWNESEQAFFRVQTHEIQNRIEQLGRYLEHHLQIWKRNSKNITTMLKSDLTVIDNILRRT